MPNYAKVPHDAASFNESVVTIGMPLRMRYRDTEGWVLTNDRGQKVFTLATTEPESLIMALAFTAGFYYGAGPGGDLE